MERNTKCECGHPQKSNAAYCDEYGNLQKITFCHSCKKWSVPNRSSKDPVCPKCLRLMWEAMCLQHREETSKGVRNE